MLPEKIAAARPWPRNMAGRFRSASGCTLSCARPQPKLGRRPTLTSSPNSTTKTIATAQKGFPAVRSGWSAAHGASARRASRQAGDLAQPLGRRPGWCAAGQGLRSLGNPDEVAERMKEYMALGIPIASSSRSSIRVSRNAIASPNLYFRSFRSRPRPAMSSDRRRTQDLLAKSLPTWLRPRNEKLGGGLESSQTHGQGNPPQRVRAELRCSPVARNVASPRAIGQATIAPPRWLDRACENTWSEGSSMACFSPTFLASTTSLAAVPRRRCCTGRRRSVNDPLLLVPAMAAATKHLGFGVTVTLSYEPPFPSHAGCPRSIT